jgi:DNA-binding transcriptional ArsR family regulator
MRNGPRDPKAVATATEQMLGPREERRMRQLLEALCDASRVKIVRALREDNSLAAGDLAHVIERSPSATSQHLKVLRDVGVVVGHRSGNVVKYSLAADLNGEIVERACSAFDALEPDAA